MCDPSLMSLGITRRILYLTLRFCDLHFESIVSNTHAIDNLASAHVVFEADDPTDSMGEHVFTNVEGHQQASCMVTLENREASCIFKPTH